MDEEAARGAVSAEYPAERPGGPAKDRQCGECGMKLSLYNPGPNCWQHTIGRPWRGPSAKPKY
jgi:hypothetical protein